MWKVYAFFALIVSWGYTASAQLSIGKALAFDFETEAGRFYQLQQSTSLEEGDWAAIGKPIKGTGETIQELFPFAEDTVFYRAVELKNQWVQVWNDEFDGEKLDMSKWGKEENNYGGGNQEHQHYSVKEKYCYLEDGKLNIAVYRDPYTSVDGKTQPYSSARIRTLQRGDWKYGRFEARAKVPGGEGIWPAIWMLPSKSLYGIWAASGEIDIMEAKGNLTDRTFAAIHYGGTWPDNTYSSATYSLPEGQFNEGFHTYAIEWYEDRIEWYVDDVRVWTQTQEDWFSENAPGDPNAPFDQEFHLIINVAVNGGFFEGTGQNANNLPDSAFPQVLEVDYVRVYQWAD